MDQHAARTPRARVALVVQRVPDTGNRDFVLFEHFLELSNMTERRVNFVFQKEELAVVFNNGSLPQL